MTTSFRDLFWKLIKEEKEDIQSIILISLTMTIVFLAVPLGVQAVVNSSLTGVFASPTFFLILSIVIGIITASWLSGIQVYSIERLEQRLFVKKSIQMFTTLSTSNFDRHIKSKDIHKFYEIFSLQKAVSHLLVDGVTVLLQLFVGFFLVSFYHPFLLVISLFLIGVSYFVLFKISPQVIKYAQENSDQKYKLGEWFFDLVRTTRLLGSSKAQEFIQNKTDQKINNYLNARQTFFSLFFKQVVVFIIIQAIATAALMAVGTFLIATGKLSIGQFVASEILITVINASLWKMQKHLASFYDLLVALGKLSDFSKEPVSKKSNLLILPSQIAVKAELKKTYLDQFNKKPTDEHSKVILPGTRFLLYGKSFSGKTQILKSLSGEVDCQIIEFSCQDIRMCDFPYSEISKSIYQIDYGSWPTETLKDNLFASQFENENKILELIQKFEIQTLLDNPHLMQKPIEEFFGLCSESEKQAFVLIRAILIEPKILIMDGFFDDIAHDKIKKFYSLLTENLADTIIAISSSDQIIIDQLGFNLKLIHKDNQWQFVP